MIKAGILFNIFSVFFVTSLFAGGVIEEGVYKASECKVKIKIISKENGYFYKIDTNKKGALKIDSDHIEFINLYSTFYSTFDEKTFPPGKQAYKVMAQIHSDHSFVIQNYGNAMNPFIVFNGCGKYLEYNKIFENLSEIERKLKNKSTYYNLKDIEMLLRRKPINVKTLPTYNNIAYYLQKAGANKEAIYLLEKILKKYPNRTVAYYNIGDAYWAIGEKEKAKHAYRTYIKQMKAKGKVMLIPKKVLNATKELVETQGDLNGYTTEGGEYRLFRDKQNNNVRLELYFYGEMGKKEQVVFFNKQSTSFVKEKSCEYNMPIYMKDDNAESFNEKCKETNYKLKKSNKDLNEIIQFILKKSL